MGEVRGIIWLVGLAGLVWVMGQWNQGRGLKIRPNAQAKVARALRPRTPEDCPACSDQGHPGEQRLLKGPVQSWSEVKSRRGRRKRLGPIPSACG